MRVLLGRNALSRSPRRAVVTIGMFDGVHVGHRRLIATTVRLAKRLRGTSVVMTFHPDAQQVLDPAHPQPRLMPLEARVQRVDALGADLLWVIPFTRTFSSISAEQFVRAILVGRLRAACVVVGQTFAFGSQREGNLSLLRRLGRAYGIRVVVVPPVMRRGAPVSSSRIRRVVKAGRLAEARRLLGRPVELFGTVVHGNRRATELGFPTANVQLRDTPLLPRGVYRVRVCHAGRSSDGLMNLGFRPTFRRVASGRPMNGAGALVCEVHLVGFRGNLYGKTVTIQVLARLREERRFDSPEALIRQIKRDLIRARLLPASSP